MWRCSIKGSLNVRSCRDGGPPWQEFNEVGGGVDMCEEPPGGRACWEGSMAHLTPACPPLSQAGPLTLYPTRNEVVQLLQNERERSNATKTDRRRFPDIPSQPDGSGLANRDLGRRRLTPRLRSDFHTQNSSAFYWHFTPSTRTTEARLHVSWALLESPAAPAEASQPCAGSRGRRTELKDLTCGGIYNCLLSKVEKVPIRLSCALMCCVCVTELGSLSRRAERTSARKQGLSKEESSVLHPSVESKDRSERTGDELSTSRWERVRATTRV